jgi:hypothetical protein
MLKDRTVMDLALLTAIKCAAIAIVYYACFAAYDGRKLDTVSHLMGPVSTLPAPQNALVSTNLNRGS